MELNLSLSDTLMQYHHMRTHTVIEGVTRVKLSTPHQVLRVVDEDECVAMEIEKEADLQSQHQDQLSLPSCLCLCYQLCAVTTKS